MDRVAIALTMTLGCTIDNPAFGLGDETGASSGSSVGSGSAETSAEATTTSAETTASGATTEPPQTSTSVGTECPDPQFVDDAPYAECFGGSCGAEGCSLGPSPGPVDFNTSVCEAICEDDCDCPWSSTGSAIPHCFDAHCELECDDNAVCPDAMFCTDDGRCVWHDAYSPCDGSCLSGRCFVLEGTGAVCAVLDCWDDGNLSVELCPPPAGGDAVPVCFEPQSPPEFLGEGWCILDCFDGRTCPPGMICDGASCFHPR